MFFNLLLSRARTELATAPQTGEPGQSRQHLFIALALQVVSLFESNSSMESFEMRVTLVPQDTLEGGERVIKLRRSLTIAAPGCPELQTPQDKLALFHQDTPYWLLGDGAITLERNDPLVQAVMVPEDDSDDRYARAFRLALHIDSCFQQLRVESFIDEVF